MDQFKLRTYDGIAVTGFLILPALFTTGLSRLVEQNGTAGWLALLISFAVMACLFLVIAYLMKKYDGKSIVEIAAVSGCGPLGIVYGVALGAYFCFFAGIHIRESAEILKIYGLSLTPIYIVAGLIFLAAVIMNGFGRRAIVKSAGFFFIIIALGLVFAMLLGLNRYNPDHLVPALGGGLPDIARNGLHSVSLFGSIMVLTLLAPKFFSAGKMIKSGMLSITFAATAYILLYVCYVMIFSPAVGAKMISGFIEIGKSSYFNHFFYRFESILLFFLIFASAIQASVSLWVARESLAASLKARRPKVLAGVCSALTLAAIFIPANILDLTRKYLPAARQYSIFFLAGFPLLILIIGTIRGACRHEKN